jgi:hypothetical protein
MPKEHEKKMPKSMNNPMLKSMKKRKEKKRKRIAHTFKAIIKKSVMIKGVQKYLELEKKKNSKFHTLTQS